MTSRNYLLSDSLEESEKQPSSQIGFSKCIALTLAKEGCDVIGTDKDIEGANQAAAEVRVLGVRQ